MLSQGPLCACPSSPFARPASTAEQEGGAKEAELLFYFFIFFLRVSSAGRFAPLMAPRDEEAGGMCHVWDRCEGSPAALDDKM